MWMEYFFFRVRHKLIFFNPLSTFFSFSAWILNCIYFVLFFFFWRTTWKGCSTNEVWDETRKEKLKQNALNYGHMPGCCGWRIFFFLFSFFFIYSIFPFQHWHIYIHFWPRFFMLRLDFITEQKKGVTYMCYRNRFRLRGWCNIYVCTLGFVCHSS